jgi:hypothetical protein
MRHCSCRWPVSPLCTAAYRGFPNALRYLLEKGAKVDGIAPPYYMGNPLLSALTFNHEGIIYILSEFNADFSIRTVSRPITTSLLALLSRGLNKQLVHTLFQEKRVEWSSIDLYGRSIVGILSDNSGRGNLQMSRAIGQEMIHTSTASSSNTPRSCRPL